MYWHRLISVFIAVVVLIYPLVIYFSIQAIEPRLLALILVFLLCTRLFFLGRNSRFFLQAWGTLMAFSCVALFAVLFNDVAPLMFYPVLINVLMLAAFGYSLLNPPSAIECLARLTHPNLPPSGVVYTRRVTQVWCLFFSLNSAAALYTALFASIDLWALYNGLIAYLLMGLLFASEWLVRQRILAREK